MSRRLCAVLLAAGEGRRLRPLTEVLPKALCPVGNVALLDRALDSVARLGLAGPDDVAVNAWHLADAIVAHIASTPAGGRPRAHVGVETGPVPLGSAGGVAALREWINGRDVLAVNADAYLAGGDLAELMGDDGDHHGADNSADDSGAVRMLGVPAGDRPREFGPHRFAGLSLIPWRFIAPLPVEPTDLVRAVWRPAEAVSALRVVEYHGLYLDCGTPADYLAANLDAAARTGVDGSLIATGADVTGHVHDTVIGAGARVAGWVERTVVWPGVAVAADERLTDAIRYAGADGTPRTQHA